jgi:hypothetical protein
VLPEEPLIPAQPTDRARAGAWHTGRVIENRVTGTQAGCGPECLACGRPVDAPHEPDCTCLEESPPATD